MLKKKWGNIFSNGCPVAFSKKKQKKKDMNQTVITACIDFISVYFITQTG